MRFKMSVLAAGVLGVALAAPGCSSSSSTSSSTPGSSTSSAAATVGFGAANATLCSATTAKPTFTNTIGTITGGATSLSGAGSTFVAPIMDDWTKAYSTPSGVKVSYASIGSGGGVAAVQANTVNFGDLSGIPSGLKFTGNVLGEIYAGKIKTWNDPALTALNPGVNLPNEPIAVVHRSDGSGTTGIWTNYLTKTPPTWVSALGGSAQSEGKTVAWPVGLGAKGNEGVSALVGQTAGALGYVEADYAIAQHLSYGQVQNKSGAFIEPCVATFVPAVDGVTFPASLNISLTDGSDPGVYPITGTTYALVYEHRTSTATAAGLVNFFTWVLTSGRDLNATLYYAPDT